MGYVEQERLRERWLIGEEKPERLQVADEGDMPKALPNHYHPFANWRETDGKGRKSVMKSWMGLIGIGLDNALMETNNRMAGEIDFEPAI